MPRAADPRPANSRPAHLGPAQPRARFYRDNARWLGAGFGLTFASSFGQTFFIALFAGEIRAEFGLSDGAWGGIYMAATLLSAALLAQAGALADRVALSRLALAAMLLYALAALTMALGQSVWLLALAVFLLRFCGQGLMGHIAMTAMGRWFRARRGRAVAIAGLGYSVGEALLPAACVAIAAAIGWRSTWALVAGLLAFALAPVFVWLLARERAPESAESRQSMAGLGGRHWSRREVLGHWAFWALVPIVLTSPSIGTVIFFHQVHIAEVKGWSLEAMALAFPVYAGITVLASLTGGAIVDRVGALRLLPVVLLPMAGATLVIGPAASEAAWLGVLAFFGVTQGLSLALWGALWPELYGTRHLGAIRALTTTAMVFATAAGPGITGVLIDLGLSFPEQAPGFALWALASSALGLGVARKILREGAPAAAG